MTDATEFRPILLPPEENTPVRLGAGGVLVAVLGGVGAMAVSGVMLGFTGWVAWLTFGLLTGRP